MRIGKWDITFLFSLFCSLIINSGMVGVVVLHTIPPKVVNLSGWHAKPGPPRVSDAPPAPTVFTPDIPPPPPQPAPPPPQKQPQPKVEFDPRQAFGERNGQGDALDSSPGERPLMSQAGPQVQAYLGRNPPRAAGGGGGAGGQGGQAGGGGRPAPPARVLIGAVSPAAAATPRMTAQPQSPPKSSPKPNPALAKSQQPPVPPPPSPKPGKDDKSLPSIAGKGDQKIDKPDPKFVTPVEEGPFANQPAPPQPKPQLAEATPSSTPAPTTDKPPTSPPPAPPSDAKPSDTTQPAASPPPAPPVRVALLESPRSPSAQASQPGKPGNPGPPGPPAPPGPPNSTPDTAPPSDKDSDPFSDTNSFKFVNGKVQARTGRLVYPVKPHLSDAGWMDASIMGHATVTFLATVDEQGNVTRVILYRTSGSDNVDLPCEQALNLWKFEPSKDKNGHPMADTLSVTFGFY
jgi:outer membrane biosynthesis protein TonB